MVEDRQTGINCKFLVILKMMDFYTKPFNFYPYNPQTGVVSIILPVSLRPSNKGTVKQVMSLKYQVFKRFKDINKNYYICYICSFFAKDVNDLLIGCELIYLSRHI